MDPNTATREEFTNYLVEHEYPPNATDEWTGRANKLQALLTKLAFHDAMAPNLQQTYMTPAASKNKVHFMWEFVGSTLGMMYQVPGSLENLSGAQYEAWADVVGRSAMAANLILDEQRGMLDQMVAMSYPGAAGPPPEFGGEVKEAATALKNERSNIPRQ